MPLPLSLPPSDDERIVVVTPQAISAAVESALAKADVLSLNETARDVLNSSGMDLTQALVGLSNIALTAKENVRLSAIKDILDIHGIQFRREVPVDSKPVFNFQINATSADVKLNSLFAPRSND